jgi:hypothetical protein
MSSSSVCAGACSRTDSACESRSFGGVCVCVCVCVCQSCALIGSAVACIRLHTMVRIITRLCTRSALTCNLPRSSNHNQYCNGRGGGEYKCEPGCGAGFKTYSIRWHHRRDCQLYLDSNELFRCSCGEGFESENGLVVHCSYTKHSAPSDGAAATEPPDEKRARGPVAHKPEPRGGNTNVVVGFKCLCGQIFTNQRAL